MSATYTLFGTTRITIESASTTLAAHIAQYGLPRAKPPGHIRLTLDDLVEPAPQAKNHPAFDVTAVDGHRFELSRYDARGLISHTGELVDANFAVKDAAGSLDAVLRVCAATSLVLRGGFLMHASCIAVEGAARVFTAPSGTGKSTIGRILRAPERPQLSDEMLAIERRAERFVACSTPFRDVASKGKPANEAALRGIFLLEQGARAALKPSADERAPMLALLRNVLIYSATPALSAAVLENVAQLVAHTSPRVLVFAKDSSVDDVLRVTC